MKESGALLLRMGNLETRPWKRREHEYRLHVTFVNIVA
jgi:hypothetical protein